MKRAWPRTTYRSSHPRRKKRRIIYTTPRVVAYQLRRLSNQELVVVDRTASDPKYRPIYEALLSRPGLGPQFRTEALEGLSALNKTDYATELIAGIKRLDQVGGEETSVLCELGRQLINGSAHRLQLNRAELERIAKSAQRALTRRVACAAIVLADGSLDRVWTTARQHPDQLVELIDALPMIPVPKLRDAYYSRIELLIKQPPSDVLQRAAIRGISYIPGHDAKTFDMLADLIRNNQQSETAILSIGRTDQETWPAERIGPLVESLLKFAASVPASDRDSNLFLEAMALGDELADRLPERQAIHVRKQLRGMGVSVFRIETVPQQMLYDQTKIEVEAGQSILIVFENNDTMTHNLIVTMPGAHEKVGAAADAMAAQPDGRARSYVPDSSTILWATKLLQPGGVAKLSFKAPTDLGVYPYFCTYPGHWRRMFGAMFVVADLDQYQADPQTYLKEHPIEIVDALLKNERSHTQWTLEELALSLEHFSHGRSFENGKQMFQFAGCVACHRVNELGHAIGPDLTKLDPKLKPFDILREILVPSQKINDDYHTVTFVLDSGRTVTGLILEQMADGVKVIENPTAEANSIILKNSEIEDQVRSNVSMMPQGLLDQLTLKEVLDLTAFVMSRGDGDNKLYHGKHRRE